MCVVGCSNIYHVAFIECYGWCHMQYKGSMTFIHTYTCTVDEKFISHVRKSREGESTSRQNTRCPYDEVKYGVPHMYGFCPYPRVLLWPNTCALSFSHSLTISPCSATCPLVVLSLLSRFAWSLSSFYCLTPSLSIFLFSSFSFSFY